MFAMQQAPAFASRKRGREAEDDMTSMGFSEHRNKRLQSLPVRPSLKQWTVPPAFPSSQMTPASSDSEDATPYQQPQSHFSDWTSSPAPTQPIPVQMPQQQHQPQPQQSLPPVDTDMDMNMDMDDAALISSPPISSATSSGRLPTPMQPSFAAQVRGSSWGAGPGPALNHINGVVNMGHEHTASGLGLVIDEEMMMDMVPRGMEADTEWHNFQNRRLPSPISEADDRSPSISGMSMRSPDMILDAGFAGSRPTWAGMQRGDGTWATGSPESGSPLNQHHHQHHIVHQNTWHPGAQPSDYDNPRPQLHVSTQVPESPKGQNSPSPGRKGHTRSRHTLNSWSCQPGMTKSFSIGYRADCEKCRNKVPGHFNHIIVS